MAGGCAHSPRGATFPAAATCFNVDPALGGEGDGMVDSNEFDDSTPVGPPVRARRRGQQRTRRRLAGTALAVMLVIGSVVIGATRFQQHDLPPTPATSANSATSAPPVQFTPLQPFGAGVEMNLGRGSGYGMTAVVGDRA
jgi:hypothetical protein